MRNYQCPKKILRRNQLSNAFETFGNIFVLRHVKARKLDNALSRRNFFDVVFSDNRKSSLSGAIARKKRTQIIYKMSEK